ncbi:MAG: guanylate kinase [Lachnospiraceae bacterium]|nr:guanylate kinase [Lachnospiraceae bacterium]
MSRGVLAVISGFSGAGKGTLMKRLTRDYDNYALSVSMTTRAPREGERDGIEYFFVDTETFKERIQQGRMLEYACYCGNYYGTPKDYVQEQLKAGRNVILEIEIQGALQIRKLMPDCLLLFVTPPSAAQLKSRLEGRGTESPEVIAKRLARAVEESEGIEAYDYIVINDDLEECVKQIHSMVQNARYTPARQETLIKEIRGELNGFSKGAE